MRTIPEWRHGRAATAFGRAVHAVLQDVDLATGGDVDPLAVAAAQVEGLTDARRGRRGSGVRSILRAAIVREAAAGESFREMYVAAPVGERVIEGYIDLLVRTPEGLVIVDYKTDALRAATPRWTLGRASTGSSSPPTPSRVEATTGMSGGGGGLGLRRGRRTHRATDRGGGARNRRDRRPCWAHWYRLIAPGYAVRDPIDATSDPNPGPGVRSWLPAHAPFPPARPTRHHSPARWFQPRRVFRRARARGREDRGERAVLRQGRPAPAVARRPHHRCTT